MKLSQLKPCSSCKGALLPFFYVVRFSIVMANQKALNSTLGLVQHFGGTAEAIVVAETMSPDAEVFSVLGDKDKSLMTELFICQECFLHKDLSLAILGESSRKETAEPVEV